MMKITALSVSRPKTVEFNGKPVETGFFNEPVSGKRMVRKLNIDGDEQADLKLHGGLDKAVYAFPQEHYPFYESAYGPGPFPFGYFGENLTTVGMSESEVRIGDRYQIGEAEFEVTQPRSPCFKFGTRMGSRQAIQSCLKSAKTGFYFRVIKEGEVEAGNSVFLTFRDAEAPSIEQTLRL